MQIMNKYPGGLGSWTVCSKYLNNFPLSYMQHHLLSDVNNDKMQNERIRKLLANSAIKQINHSGNKITIEILNLYSYHRDIQPHIPTTLEFHYRPYSGAKFYLEGNWRIGSNIFGSPSPSSSPYLTNKVVVTEGCCKQTEKE